MISNYEEPGDDSIVPSTPTLYVPRRADGFSEAVSSPQPHVSINKSLRITLAQSQFVDIPAKFGEFRRISKIVFTARNNKQFLFLNKNAKVQPQEKKYRVSLSQNSQTFIVQFLAVQEFFSSYEYGTTEK